MEYILRRLIFFAATAMLSLTVQFVDAAGETAQISGTNDVWSTDLVYVSAAVETGNSLLTIPLWPQSATPMMSGNLIY